MKDSFILFVFVVMIALVCFCETQAMRARADNVQLRETLRQNEVTVGNMSAEIAVYKVEATTYGERVAILEDSLDTLNRENTNLQVYNEYLQTQLPMQDGNNHGRHH